MELHISFQFWLPTVNTFLPENGGPVVQSDAGVGIGMGWGGGVGGGEGKNKKTIKMHQQNSNCH